mgnify:CR=1 FL=1
MAVLTKSFQASLRIPLPTPDGTSLEEPLNTFLATLDPKNVIDVLVESHATGKYGITTTHFASVVHRT